VLFYMIQFSKKKLMNIAHLIFLSEYGSMVKRPKIFPSSKMVMVGHQFCRVNFVTSL